MKILYISTYNDDKYYKEIFEQAIKKPLQSVQKFNKLLVGGLEKNEQVNEITVLTTANVNQEISNKKFWKGRNKKVNKTKFHYIPFLNLKFIKQICMGLYSFIYVFIWVLLNIRKNPILISDGFYPIVSSIASIVFKLFSIPVVTFYTDLPKVSATDLIEKTSFTKKIIKKIVCFGDYINMNLSDMFILLTVQMNEVINPKNKPYIIMEGLVDSEYLVNKTNQTKKKKAIMYAGGLYEKYGVKLLIDSFIAWNNKDYELWLCGQGELDDYIKKQDNSNIKFYGVIPNNKVLELEEKATLLINPRFTNEEYTKYSFPSKNMEYMLSGTPLLTTRLPGMPKEYYKHVYFIEKETKDGFIDAFDDVLIKNNKELINIGKSAQEFVLNEKNNVIQGEKIIKFINDNLLTTKEEKRQ